MADLPTGMVTFLFTDIEGSTRLWEEDPHRMRPALVRHDALCRTAVVESGADRPRHARWLQSLAVPNTLSQKADVTPKLTVSSTW